MRAVPFEVGDDIVLHWSADPLTPPELEQTLPGVVLEVVDIGLRQGLKVSIPDTDEPVHIQDEWLDGLLSDKDGTSVT